MESLFNKVACLKACSFTQIQEFFCEIWGMFINTSFYRTPPVNFYINSFSNKYMNSLNTLEMVLLHMLRVQMWIYTKCYTNRYILPYNTLLFYNGGFFYYNEVNQDVFVFLSLDMRVLLVGPRLNSKCFIPLKLDVKWSYIICSENIQDISWMSCIPEIYTL